MGKRISQQDFFSHGKTDSCGVLIGYYETKQLEIINKKFDTSGRILLLEISIDDSHFVMRNIYNANNEPEHLKTLSGIGEICDCVCDIQNKTIIFESFFEAQGWTK